MAIEFVLDAQDRKRINRLLSEETATRIGSIMFKAFSQAAATVEGKLKDNVRGPILKVRSSRLINSIGSRVDPMRNGQITATIGSGARGGERVPYALIHELGGTIEPGPGKQWLTIPTSNAKTAGGDKKAGYTARNLFNGQIPGFKGAFVKKWETGGIIFGIMTGAGKNKLLPLFILAKKVQMPARKYLSKTLEQSEKEIPNIVVEAVAKELRRGMNGN